MTNLFIVRYRDGGIQSEELHVLQTKYHNGDPTRAESEKLQARGYCEWVNVTNVLASYNEARLKEIGHELGMVTP